MGKKKGGKKFSGKEYGAAIHKARKESGNTGAWVGGAVTAATGNPLALVIGIAVDESNREKAGKAAKKAYRDSL